MIYFLKRWLFCNIKVFLPRLTRLKKAANALRTTLDQPEIQFHTGASVLDSLDQVTAALEQAATCAEEKRLYWVATEEELSSTARARNALLKRVGELEAASRQTACSQQSVEVRQAQEQTPAHKKLIEDLIQFRDYLDIYTENAVQEQRQELEKLLRNLTKETGRILGRASVEVLHETGSPFQVDIQEVVSVVETKDPSLNDTVCSSESDGYRMDGILFRPQKVVLYTYRG